MKNTGKISAFAIGILIGRERINQEPDKTRMSGSEEWERKVKGVAGQEGRGTWAEALLKQG